MSKKCLMLYEKRVNYNAMYQTCFFLPPTFCFVVTLFPLCSMFLSFKTCLTKGLCSEVKKIHEFRNNFKQEGHDGPEITHLNIETLNDKEQVILFFFYWVLRHINTV
jgi:hypothetical protein